MVTVVITMEMEKYLKERSITAVMSSFYGVILLEWGRRRR